MNNLFNYNMEQLKEIARNRQIKGYSKLKKENLVKKIEESLLDEDYAYEFFKKINKKEFDILTKSFSKKYILDSDYADGLILEDYGYIYVTDEREILLEKPIKNLFEKIQTNQFKKDRQRYQLINDYCDAAINLYGIFSMEKIIEIINEQNDIKIDKEEMEKFLSSTFLDITYEEGYLYESLPPFEYGSEIFIDEMKTLLENQSLKPYYVPPKEEFLKYRDVSYFEKNKEYNNLHKYFCKKTHNNKKLASIICDEIHYNCTRGVSFQNIFDYMESFNIIFDSEKDAKTCIDMIVKLNNNTRMMENRGHTAAEISKWRSSILSQSNKKISRNEPCPCGSGKKYKKCCGK